MLHCLKRSVAFALVLLALAAARTTSTAAAANNPLYEYELIKPLVRAQLHAVDYGSRSSTDEYNLASCGDMELALGLGAEKDAETDALARIAGYTYTWETELPSHGYPSQTVLALTRDIEARLLSYVVSHSADSSFNETFYERIRMEADNFARELTRLAEKQRLQGGQSRVHG